MKYDEFFEALTGFPPFLYQKRLSDMLFAGQSVILRAPTGAGKTWASVAPFLYSLETGTPIADSLIYTLPLRSLASSLHASVLKAMETVMPRVCSVGKDREYDTNIRYCSLQTGAQKDDPFFESDLVFTTIDQVLSNYLSIPVSLPDRLGNINPGALIGSMLVFDEVHLLDPAVALGTVVEMLDRLKGLAQFVLMTATLSTDATEWLARKLGLEEVIIADSEIQTLPSQRTKRRSWQYVSMPITASAVTAHHAEGRTIVLVNSVGHAQALFLELEEAYSLEGSAQPELLLLHARFFPDHRRAIEDQLAEYFGPKATKSNVILVTTQVIEAGIDISADCLHTELAPMNALIQRAGRVARYQDRNIGTVIVYEISRLGPYRDERLVIDDTRGVLKTALPQECVIEFTHEREWIKCVHSKSETAELCRYDSLWDRRALVHSAMDEGDRGRLSQLVRDIDSVSVLIHSNPEEVNFSGKRWPLLLGVPSVSLMSLSSFFDSIEPGKWVAKGAWADKEEEGPGLSLRWEPISSAGQLRAQWLVALHPDYASYKPRLGLLLGRGGEQPPLLYADFPNTPRYQYDFETWADHSQRVVKQMQVMQPAYSRAAFLLGKKYDLAPSLIEDLVELVCALHDTGKLAAEWQTVAWRWQDDKDARMRAAGASIPERPRVPIAHTWFDPVADKQYARASIYRLPPHAVQGAYAIANLICAFLSVRLDASLEIVAARALVSAVARHHGPRVGKLCRFSLDPQAEEAIRSGSGERYHSWSLSACSARSEESAFSDVLLRFGREDDRAAWPLYAFLVRRLRLADQASLSDKTTLNVS
jgi:CRISPR-associated endonuclease/helicase Cas3